MSAAAQAPCPPLPAAQVRYRKLLAGVQLTRDFFFSYTWPIHQSVQRTFDQVGARVACACLCAAKWLLA